MKPLKIRECVQVKTEERFSASKTLSIFPIIVQGRLFVGLFLQHGCVSSCFSPVLLGNELPKIALLLLL